MDICYSPAFDQLGWLAKTPRKQKSHFYPDLCHFVPPFCTQNPKSNRGTKPFSRIFSKASCAIRLCSISSASSKPAQGLGLVRMGADPFYNWLTKGLQQEVLTPPVKKKKKMQQDYPELMISLLQHSVWHLEKFVAEVYLLQPSVCSVVLQS